MSKFKPRKIKIQKYNNYELILAQHSISDLIAEKKKELCTATEIGRLVGITSGAAVNKYFRDMGMLIQIEVFNAGKYWEHTEEGSKYGEMFVLERVRVPVEDGMDKHHLLHMMDDGDRDYAYEDWKTVYTYSVRWDTSIVPVLKEYLKANGIAYNK